MKLLILCYLNPDLTKVKIACCWNGGRTIHLFETVCVRSARRVALFSAFGKMELRKCGGSFSFSCVHSGSLCQMWIVQPGLHPRFAIIWGEPNFTSRRWRFVAVDSFYKKDS